VTKGEWYEVATELQARWPNREIPRESIEIWYRDLESFPIEQVRAAIAVLYRERRDWCPNGAQILAKLQELQRDDPDHGEAWRLVKRALLRYGVTDWPAFYRSLPRSVEIAARRYGFEPVGYLTEEEPIVRAQFREIYRGVVAERERQDAYAGLPSAGLKRLEGMRKIDPKRILLPSGEAVR